MVTDQHQQAREKPQPGGVHTGGESHANLFDRDGVCLSRQTAVAQNAGELFVGLGAIRAGVGLTVGKLASQPANARVYQVAAIDLPDENVRVSRIEPEGEHQVMVHTASPQGLLQMAKSIFLAEPEAWLVAIPVAETGIGESLTPMALRGVEEATRKVLELVG